VSTTEQLAQLVNRVMAPWKGKVLSMVGRALLEAVGDDSTGVQLVKVTGLKDEVLEDLPHVQPGGLVHYPIPGSEGVLFSIGGDRDNAVVAFLADRDTRPKDLNPGETGLYSNATGESYTGGLRIHLDNEGNVIITPFGSAQCKIDGDAEITGQLIVQGQIYGKDEITAKHGGGASVTVTEHLTPSPFGPVGPPTGGT
jgi:phage gp45-like